jgi:hypothetical protein
LTSSSLSAKGTTSSAHECKIVVFCFTVLAVPCRFHAEIRRPQRATPAAPDRAANLAWADAYHERIGRWPTLHSGTIPDSGGEKWMSVNNYGKPISFPRLVSRAISFPRLVSRARRGPGSLFCRREQNPII